MRLVIAGGGAGALATARAYREAGGDGDVTLVTREAMIPYTRPALSKEFLRGELTEDELPIEPDVWFADNDVEVRTDVVTAVRDSGVVLRDETLRFDACVLATGAEPKQPFGGAHVLRGLADARTLREAAEQATHATVIGSGFIGCEAAASLAMRGLDAVADFVAAGASLLVDGTYQGNRFTFAGHFLAEQGTDGDVVVDAESPVSLAMTVDALRSGSSTRRAPQSIPPTRRSTPRPRSRSARRSTPSLRRRLRPARAVRAEAPAATRTASRTELPSR